MKGHEMSVERESFRSHHVSWWRNVDFNFILLVLVAILSVYAWEMVSDVQVRRDAWMKCAGAKEVSEPCRIILQYR